MSRWKGDKIMMRWTIYAGCALLAAGCAQSPELTDEEWITELVEKSGVAQTSNLNGTGDPSGNGNGNDVGLPEVWYRQLVNEPSAEILLENDPSAGVCTVTVIHSLEAEFIIDTVHDGVFLPGSKPIEDIRYIRLIAEKDDNEDAYGGWRIVSATPAEHMLAGDGQEVFITSMSIYKDDGLIWSCTDPGEFYDVNEELPLLVPGDFVRMEATVNHLDPQYDPPLFVVAHGPLSGHSRHMMYDNGLYGDQIADDGVYSYEWYVEYTGEHQRIAVDVIDGDTFADQTEDDYDAGAWGIAYLR